MISDTAYEENGGITQTCDFAFSEPDEAENESAREIACACQRRIWEWVYQAPCEDIEGFTCRAIILVWIFSPWLRGYNMTQTASRFGKKKQSLGRFIGSFKNQFPELADLVTESDKTYES